MINHNIMNETSILKKYKNTLKSFLEITQGEKVLYCDNESFIIINNVFPPSAISKLKIIGISKFDESFDPEIIDKIKHYPTLILLQTVTNDEIFSKINTVVCLSGNVYILLLKSKDRSLIDKFKHYNNIRYLGMMGLDFVPVSSHIISGINSENITTISSSKPSQIIKYSKTYGMTSYIGHDNEIINSMLEGMTRTSPDNNVFVFVEHEDELINNVHCWSYEYLLHKYITLDGTHFRNAKRDPIYENIRHMDFSKVIKYLSDELTILKKKSSPSNSSGLLLDHTSNKTKIYFVNLHLSFLDTIKSKISNEKIFDQSELENSLLLGINIQTLGGKLSHLSEERIRFLSSQSKNIGNGECSSLLGYKLRNFSLANTIKTIISKLKNVKKEKDINNFFFYISSREGLNLEEVAEVEILIDSIRAKTNNSFEIVIMTDKIKCNQNLYTSYMFENDNSLTSSFKPKIFITKENIKEKTLEFIELREKIGRFSEESSKIFDKDPGHIESLKNEIAILIRNEFDKLQVSPDTDSYTVRSTKQRNLIELQEIVKKYKKIINSRKAEQVSSFDDNINCETNVDDYENQMLLQSESSYRDEEINEKVKGIEEIERNVNEINQLFIDINLIIRDQGEMLDNIEMNVLSASDFVERGVAQLHRAETYQKSAHSKAKYILGGLLGIGGILGVILGTKLKR